MTWQDRESRYRDSDGRGGGFRAALGRIFGDADNPLGWALTLYRAWGITVRLHLVFLIFIVAELIHASVSSSGLGFQFALFGMVALFLLVLLHEYGHCIACRRVGGEADDILMWPLGGLATCLPPDHWRAHLWTAVGGPLVNVLLIPLFAGAVLVLTGEWRAVLFNPFSPGAGLAAAQLSDGTTPLWLIAVWWLHYANLILLAFNVLVPMYPMDGGRILQAILWRSLGYRRSMEIAVKIGLAAAIAMFVFAIVFGQTILIAIAIFGGITCWAEKKRLEFMGEDWLGGGHEFMPEPNWRGDREPPAPKPDRRKPDIDPEEIDAILAKISRQGMDSLTRTERRKLRRATSTDDRSND
ncbi:MAG: site-2 protease family protein [Phycisphaerales bacterium JB037]